MTHLVHLRFGSQDARLQAVEVVQYLALLRPAGAEEAHPRRQIVQPGQQRDEIQVPSIDHGFVEGVHQDDDGGRRCRQLSQRGAEQDESARRC